MYTRIAGKIRDALLDINSHSKFKEFTVHKNSEYVEPYEITIRDIKTQQTTTYPRDLENFDQAYQGYSATQVVAFLNGMRIYIEESTND